MKMTTENDTYPGIVSTILWSPLIFLAICVGAVLDPIVHRRRSSGVLVLAAVLLLSSSVQAAEKKITVAQALSMLSATRNLDGRVVVVKSGGADTTVVTPWEFGSAPLRLRIAKNMTILATVEKALEDTRKSIVKEILKSSAPDKDGKLASAIVPGTPEYDDFQKQIGDALNDVASVEGLQRIKASELRLDKNEIPVSVLSALAPILDE